MRMTIKPAGTTMLLMALGLAACGPQTNNSTDPAKGAAAAAAPVAPAASLDPVLAEPLVGDIYAAKLSAFSAHDFSDNDTKKKLTDTYGLMKVVAVDANTITVITEQGAWPEPRGALGDLRGTMADITWDETERIPIRRLTLADLVRDGKLLESRRMTNGR